jgi:RHS repeat-associated protein
VLLSPGIHAGTRTESPHKSPSNPLPDRTIKPHMQLSSNSHIPDGLLAANALLREKPHQGVPSWKSALHQGIDERNSTAAIGLRVGQHLNRAWSRYTGKERDQESGLDYFGARYYASSMGRFMSPDWAAQEEPVPYAVLGDPQSLNLYSYVRNNPLSHADPDGHDCPTCQKIMNWLSSSHSSSASASGAAGQSTASSGGLTVTAGAATGSAKASASYGTNNSLSAKVTGSVASVTAKEGGNSTTQVDALTANAGAHAGVGTDPKTGIGASAGAGAGAYVLSGSQTESVTIGSVTITGSATGNVGVGANASASIGTGGVSASAGVTPGFGGAVSLGVTWGGMTASGGGSVKGNGQTTTTKIDQPKIQPQ